jgi:hypothetical protein
MREASSPGASGGESLAPDPSDAQQFRSKLAHNREPGLWREVDAEGLCVALRAPSGSSAPTIWAIKRLVESNAPLGAPRPELASKHRS